MYGLPSKGFIIASLAIVALAPLKAVSGLVCLQAHHAAIHTCSKRMVLAICLVTTCEFFDDLVATEIYCMSGACILHE